MIAFIMLLRVLQANETYRPFTGGTSELLRWRLKNETGNQQSE